MSGLILKYNGVEKTIANIDAMTLAIKDMTPAFKASGLVVLESVNRNFIEGGRPEHWRSLALSTLQRRAEKTPGFKKYKKSGQVSASGEKKFFGSAQPLRDTGLLMLSIGNPSQQGIKEVTRNFVRIGTNVPYAAAQNYGYKQIPARPFMVLQPADEETILKIFSEHIAGGKE